MTRPRPQQRVNHASAGELSREVQRFIENVGLFYERQGIPRIGGRIVGLLLVADSPLSAEQIATTLGVSRASVSTNLRALGTLSLIEPASVPGARCDYYQFSARAWERATQARIQAMQGLGALAEQGLDALPDDNAARGRLARLLSWTQRMAASDRQALDEWTAQDVERED